MTDDSPGSEPEAGAAAPLRSRWTRPEPLVSPPLARLSSDPRFAPPPPRNLWERFLRLIG